MEKPKFRPNPKTYGYKKHANSKPNWPLPPYAVFKCRPTTPWTIPEDFKALEIGPFDTDFALGGAPQVAILTAAGYRSSDDSLDANVLNMEEHQLEHYRSKRVPMDLPIPSRNTDTDGSSSSPTSPTTPESKIANDKPRQKKSRISKPRAGGVLPGALPDNFLY